VTLASLLNPPPAASSQDLSHLLTSNDLPLEFEIPHIHDIVSESQNRIGTLEAQMSALEEEILRLQANIAQLAQRHAESMEHICQHRAMISPVRCGPPE
jgi:predicted  nucleic acid-binding Zn-ribbon protein